MSQANNRDAAHIQIIALLLGVFFMAGFILWRAHSTLVWNDSVSWVGTHPYVANLSCLAIIKESFSSVAGAGYRPLSGVISLLGAKFITQVEYPPFAWVSVVGFIYGLLAYLYCQVANRFLKNSCLATYTVFVLMFSASILSAAWIVVAGIQAIVNVIFCLGFLCYWGTLESERHKLFYYSGLVLVFFVGPWFREFCGLLPFLILLSECFRKKMHSPQALLAALAFLHALFPTFLPYLVGFHGLPLRPVYQLGDLSNQLGQAAAHSLYRQYWLDLRWYAAWCFLALFPLFLYIPLLLNPIISFWKTRSRFSLCTLLVFFVIIFVALVLHQPRRIGILLCVMLGLMGLRQDKLLGSWFLITFLPFLKVYTEIVHLAYPVLPAAIILLGATQSLWKNISEVSVGWLRKGCYCIMASLLTLALINQTAQVYGTYRVMHQTYEGFKGFAIWARSHLPPGSVIIGSVLSLKEMAHYSAGYFSAYSSLSNGWGNADVLEDSADFERFVKENLGKRAIYLLEVEGSVRHNDYTQDPRLSLEDRGIVFAIKATYPYLALIPHGAEFCIPFLGAPDLVNDFYRGPSRNHPVLAEEVSAKYHLYQVTGVTKN